VVLLQHSLLSPSRLLAGKPLTRRLLSPRLLVVPQLCLLVLLGMVLPLDQRACLMPCFDDVAGRFAVGVVVRVCNCSAGAHLGSDTVCCDHLGRDTVCCVIRRHVWLSGIIRCTCTYAIHLL
jgi:hypothetical protein